MVARRNAVVGHRRSGVVGAVLMAVCVLAQLPLHARAQAVSSLAGDYAGVLGPLHLKLHLAVDATGGITGTLDSPDQGAIGLPCADFKVSGHALAFTVPSVHGSWKGEVSADRRALAGTWDQGNPMPLTFKRYTFVPAARPSRADGVWLGALATGSASLRLQLHVKSDSKGREFCSLDSLDQHAMGLECANAVLEGDALSFDVPAVGGHYAGTLSADGSSLTGEWSQHGNSLPLTLTRR